MSQMMFVVAAYVITIGGSVALSGWAWLAMRNAEQATRR